MPWSVKAQGLLREQYASVGAASVAALTEAMNALEGIAHRNAEAKLLLDQFQERKEMSEKYVEAYGHYCWPVDDLNDLKLAPFHLLATEGSVHVDKNHIWHMDTLASMCQQDEALLLATPYRVVDVTDPESCEAGIRWWESLTEHGGEGMVLKPLEFIAKNNRQLIQPAIKSRGREYLRIIYGPEYTLPENLERLRSRGLSKKRSLAIREFSLGIEALERFISHEPLYRVHECVFGVLALESEPVDPRL